MLGRMRLAVHGPIIAVVAVVMAPLVWAVSVAFRPNSDLDQLLPGELTFANFPATLQRVPGMWQYFLDSILITSGTIFGVCLLSTLAGYAFSRLRFRGKNILMWLMVLPMFIPAATSVASLYVQYVDWGLLDTRQGLVFAYTAWDLAFAILIMKSVFSGIPVELDEAARIDGAGPLTVLWRILTPLAKGGIIIVALLSFVSTWGEYLMAFTLAGDAVRPMSIGIQFFEPSPSDVDYTFNVGMAASMLMFAPSIAIYVAFQRYFAKGLADGALKG